MTTRSAIYRKEQERKEITQHAKKIDQGFRRLNEIDEQRAIWELFQNAIDLSDGNCEITIQLTEETIIFSHNSKVFTPSDLSSLNKQYSLKTSEDNEEEVGQYGTGFLSTHSFGKSLEITSSLDFGYEYTDLVKFPLNRNYNTLLELEESIITQEKHIQDILDSSDFYESPRIITTSLEYSAKEEKEKKAAKESLLQIQNLVPYVFTFCIKLSTVTIKSFEHEDIIYTRVKSDETDSSSLKQLAIKKNEEEITINYLQKTNEDGKIRFKVIIPQDKQNNFIKLDTKVPRLFLFYPLIGSHDFGFNFIIHSKDFFVNEKRSTIELESDNQKLATEEAKNRDLINEISETIFSYLKSNINNCSNLIDIASINFKRKSDNELVDIYFTKLQTKWVTEFTSLKLVETRDETKAPKDILFISNELIEENESFSEIYDLIVSLNWDKSIPKNKDIAQRWTMIVDQWKSEEINYIDIDSIVEKIESKNISAFPKDKLLSFYKFVIKSGNSAKIENKKLFPNLNGDFCVQVKLLRGVNIHESFIPLIKSIKPDILKDIVQDDFILTLPFKEYNRQKLYQDFKDEFDSYFQQGGEFKNETIREEKIKNLTQLCNINSTKGAQNHRTELVELIKNKYGFEISELIILNIEEDKFDYDSTPLSALIRLVANDMMLKTNIINGTSNPEHLEFIKLFVSKVNTIGQHKSLLENLTIFPNQLGVLCKPIEVAKESGFFNDIEQNDYFKDIYLNVIKKDVRKSLVDPFFLEGFDAIKSEIQALTIAGTIENEFLKEKLDEINIHNHRVFIFEIIKRMTDEGSLWAKIFHNIETKKEIIMMSKMTNKETKNDLFKIIGLDANEISILSQLSEKENIEEIIRRGEEAIKQIKDSNYDFEFKKSIGVHIEYLLRNRLNEELKHLVSFSHPKINDKQEENISAEEMQGGQDIVIMKNGKIVYYIEVKSRWNSRNSIYMSTLQSQRAAQEKYRFALCYVDMCNYFPEDGTRHKVENLSLIEDRIKVITDIGTVLDPLIKEAISNDKVIDNVKLVEYRSIIPQEFIDKKNIDLDTFVETLKEIINDQPNQ